MTLIIDIIDSDRLALFAAVQDDVHLVFAELADRHVERDVVVLADRLHHGMVDGLRVAIPRPDCAVREALAFVRHDQIGVELHLAAEAGAGGAGAVRAVEAEGARLDLGQADAAVRRRRSARRRGDPSAARPRRCPRRDHAAAQLAAPSRPSRPARRTHRSVVRVCRLLLCLPGSTTSRSTTTSMVCFL